MKNGPDHWSCIFTCIVTENNIAIDICCCYNSIFMIININKIESITEKLVKTYVSVPILYAFV